MANEKEFSRNSLTDPPARASSTGPSPPFPSANRVHSAVFVVFAAIIGGVIPAPSHAIAAPPQASPLFGDSLRRSTITLSVEGQSVEKVLRSLLESVNLGTRGKPNGPELNRERPWSLWLDRRVDPSQPINIVAAGQPASQVLLRAIEPLNWVAYPLPGVLLVGRPEWVRQTLIHLPSEPAEARRETSSKNLVTVQWPVGSTAREALASIVTARTDVSVAAIETSDTTASWMPHDIWNAGGLKSVDRTLATALVLAQFDLRYQRQGSLSRLLTQDTKLPSGVTLWEKAQSTKPFSQMYPSGDSATAVRTSLDSKETRSSVRAKRDGLLVLATVENHIDAIKAMWNVVPAKAAGQPNNQTTAVFDLKLINKPVAEVLSQLTSAAGKRLLIESEADLASQRLVSLDASQKTLQQLAEQVAGAVGLTVQWDEADVIISKAIE